MPSTTTTLSPSSWTPPTSYSPPHSPLIPKTNQTSPTHLITNTNEISPTHTPNITFPPSSSPTSPPNITPALTSPQSSSGPPNHSIDQKFSSPLRITLDPPSLTLPPPTINIHPMETRSKTGIYKPKLLSTRHPFSSALSTTLQIYTPTTFKQASSDPHWKAAMTAEFEALKSTCTWTLVPPPHSHNIIGSKWVYRVKYSLDRYKAQHVAKGFLQQHGIDYHETFSPVAKPTTIKLILSLVVQFNWQITQWDISNAFLHGTLHEDVHMVQPQGFVDPLRPHFVCKLHKSIYGVKQAPRAWYEELCRSLIALGFRSSNVDPSLFVKGVHSLTFILVYVDDILITGNSSSHCEFLINKLSTQFAMKNLGPLHFFLGIQAHLTADTLFLCQTKHAHDLLTKANMVDSKPCASPSSASKPAPYDGELLQNPTMYKSLVGALQYLTWTRPNIVFSVSQFCQHLQNPRTTHFTAVKRIL
ncbi:hypothetical protein C1H46_010118 [Malus baccata]|uniref:Reverse transcriptase Ty1/copia-type domain-containing protein n=1 Tax=Malus baccata TaxID=106549 RepID=A0A540N1D5_MALBA|nr:hypothetical protein C1H46_010118 [Malus baccata]